MSGERSEPPVYRCAVAPSRWVPSGTDHPAGDLIER